MALALTMKTSLIVQKTKIEHLENLFGYLGAPKVTFVSSTAHFVGCKMDKHIRPQM